jgi:hypothetical protein
VSLALLAAHMAGDYLFQTDWMAREKFTNHEALFLHSLVYALCFVPLCALGLNMAAPAFILVTHLVIDSRRWASGKAWPAKPILVDQSLHLIVLALVEVAA